MYKIYIDKEYYIHIENKIRVPSKKPENNHILFSFFKDVNFIWSTKVSLSLCKMQGMRDFVTKDLKTIH